MSKGRLKKRQGKKGVTTSMPPLWMRVIAYLLCVVLTDGQLAFAMPQGGHIASGSGTISTSGKTMTIRQKSPNLTINWNSFNIGKSQTVQFLQPGASSIALNQIGGVSASYIYGHLLANGQIFLINPSGIVFGPGAQVDVGGLIASTLDLVKNGFANTGTLSFSGRAPGTITNAGILKALPGGYIALLGQDVTNTGTIEAPRGTVTFGAGNRIDLDFNGGSLVSLAVTQNTLDSIAANGGLVSAEGGKILLSAGAQDSIVKSVVNNTGVLEAQTVADRNGEIVLLSGLASGTTNVSGTLDASAPSGGNGGTIETSGSRVNVANGTVVTTSAPGGKTGSWTLDPASFYIGANTTGSTSATLGQVLNYQDISGSELGTLLASTNVIVDSTQGREGALGNIYVDNPVSWSTTNTLTLNAVNNIEINSALTNTASGYSKTQTTGLSTPSPLPNTPLLVLRSDDMDLGGTATNTSGGGVPSGNGTVAVNSGGSISVAGPVEIYYNPSNYSTPTAYTNANSSAGSLAAYMLISSLNDLNYLSANQNTTTLSNNYALNTNLSYSTNNTSSFTPLGNTTTNYTGYFNGLNHSISNLYQNYTTGTDGGFIGFLGTSGWVRNLDLINETIVGNSGNLVGGLVGSNNGTVENVTVTGSISSNYDGGYIWLGGLVGANAGTVAESTADVAMNLSITSSQNDNVGGFVAQNQNNGSFVGLITSSVAEGNVFVVNGQSAGGFDGASNGGSSGATIEHSYSTGSVTGQSSSTNFGIGGFAGVLLGTNTIENSYSLGSVSGSSQNQNNSPSSEPAGGFIGNIWSGANNTLSNNAWNSSAFVANSGAQASGGIGYVQNGATYSASSQVVPQSFSNLETPADVGGLGTISTSPLVSTTSTVVSAGGNTSVTTYQGAPNTWVFINPTGTLASSTQTTAAATTPMLASEYSTNIATLHQLELMNLAPQGSYTLLESLNAAATGSSSGDVFGSQGFVRVGSGSQNFTGSFNGQGNVISNLTINDSSNGHVGLFGVVGAGGTVENLTLANANILSTFSGTVYAGGIAGANSGTISGVSVTGTVEGSDNTGSMTGGVAGYNTGTLTNGWSGATVAGTNGTGTAGGVTGVNDTGGTVEDSYFTGILGGASLMGGIAGKNAGTVTTTYDASVEGYNAMANGALVGDNTGSLENSYYDAGLFPNAYGTNSGTTTNVNGLMPSQMTQTGNFGSFVFSNTPGATGNSWVIVDTNGSLNNAGGTNGSLLPMLVSEAQSQIGTMHQLELMNMNLSGNYSLAASLDGNVTGVTGNGTDVFGSAGFVRVGGGSYASTPTPFTGTFNGNNRTISNLTINDATNMNVGLFGNLNNATVENLVLLDPNIQSTNPVNLGYNNNRILMGGIAGNMSGGTIENVEVIGGQIKTTSENEAGVVVGGLVGNSGIGTISSSYESATVSVSAPDEGSSSGPSSGSGNNINAAGIVGNTGSGLSLQNDYATGSVSESGYGDFTGGILGADNSVTVKNVYFSGTVTASPVNGSSISDASGLWGTGSGSTTNTYWNSSLISQGTGNGGSGGSGLSSSQMQTASNFSGLTFTATPGLSGNNWVIVDTNGTLNNASGSGATTPMLASEYSQQIRTLHQLELMNMVPASSYQLENNIDASPTSSTTGSDVFGSAGFVRVGGSSTPFSGSFNGNGHAISNLTINDATNTNVGLFGKATNATIENLLLKSPTVKSTVTSASQTADPYAIGSVVGWLDGGTMSNVGVVWGTVSSQIEGSVSGILAGELGTSATIENSYVDHGTLTFSSTEGNNSYYNSGNSWGGLIAGYNLGTIQNSYTTGNLILGNAGSGGYAISMGGIVGLQGSVGSIKNTWDTVTLEDGSTATGGGGPAGLLVGYLAGGSISNSWGEGLSTNVVNGSTYNSDTSANGSGSKTLGSSSGSVGSNVGVPSNGLTASDYAGLNFTTTPGLSGNNWVMVDTNGTLNNASGAGGATGPMLSSEYSRSIQTVHQLELMNMMSGGVYTLGGTVDASATSSSNQRLFAAGTFVRVGGSATPFSGVLNGNGNTVDNLTINDSTNTNVGLIGELSGSGAVANVGMTVPGGGSNYTTYSVQGGKSGQNLAALVGDNNGGTVALTQSNLDITGTASGAQNIGTTVGLSSGLVMGDGVSGGPQVTKTTSSDTVGGDSIGGVVGRTMGAGLVFGATSFTDLLTATTSSGTPSGGIGADVGGVAGQLDGGVPTNQAGVYSYGVSSTNDPVGIVNSSGDGAYVTGWNGEIGGLVGASQNSIVGSQSTANVSGGGALLGGLLGGGWWGLEIVNSHATGSVTSNASGGGAGGLVGAFSGGTSGSLGTGYFYNALVQNSYAGGNVKGNNDSGNVGGLVGLTLSNTTVSSSYYGTNANAGGTVSGGSSTTGGLVGANAGTIENSEVGLDYGINVNGSQGSVGGLAGSNSGTITDSYANALQSTSGATSGGLVGTNSGSVSYSFYNNQTTQTNNTPIGSSSGGTANDAIGIAASSFGSQSTFTSATSNNGNVNPNWNFSTVWIQGAHVPLLLGILPVETVTSSNASQLYSGSSSNNGAVITTSGWNGATSQNLASGSLSYSYGSGAPNAGSYSITPSGLTVNTSSFTSMHSGVGSIVYQNGTLLITPKALTVTVTDPTMVYNGTVSGTLSSSNVSISGWVGSEGATINTGSSAPGVTYSPTTGTSATPTVGSANVGSYLTAMASIGDSNLTANSGTNLSNYTLPSSETVNTGSITPAPLTVTLASSVNKTYDTSSNAYLVSSTTSETAGGITQSVAPDVTVSGWVTPTGGQTQGATFNGVIGSYLSGGSAVSSAGSGYTVTALVGAGNLTPNSGTTLSNYAINGTQLSGSNSTTLLGSGNITPAPLTLTLTAPTKTYDGTTSAYLTSASGGVSESAGGISQTVGPNATLSGFATGQGATVTATGTYTSGGSSVSNAGSGYGVTATVGTANFSSLLSGTTLSNYEIGGTQLTGANTVTVSGTGGAINPAPLSLVLSNPSKTYDGTSTAFLTSSLETLTSSNISETIVPNATVTGFVTGQGASFAGTGSYATGSSSQTAPNVGSGYTVSASSLPSADFTANSGTSLSNYTLPTSASVSTGSITPAPLTVTLNTPTKPYDTTTTASLTSSNTTVSGFAGSEGATLTASGNYLSPNVGTNIGIGATVTGSDFTGSGGFVASNYAIGGTTLSGSNSAPISGTGTITQAALTATGTQVYNGTTSFSGSNLTVSGVGGQSFAASGSGTLGSSGNVQTSQSLTSVSGLTLTGLGGASLLNYQSFSPSDTTVSVTPAPLTVTVGSVTKTYDGTTTASLTSANTTVSGFVSGQGGSFNGASGTYSGTSGSNRSPDVGTGYTVNASVGASNFTNLLSGTTLSNYEIGSTQLTGANTATVSGTQGAITAAPLSLSTTASQTYNGNTGVSLTSSNTTLAGMVSGQTGAGLGTTVTVNGTFASPNAGSNVGGTVSLSSSDLTGNSAFTSALSAGDYTLPTGFTGGGITPAPLTLTITPSKVYDGTTTAYLTSSGESVTAGGISQTVASNVSVSGWVTPTGGTAQGATFNNTTGTFSQSNVGSSLSFTAQLSSGSFTPNSGTTLSNYAIAGTQLSAGNTASVSGTGTITPAPLSVTLSPTKNYDGSTNAYLTSSGETVTTNGITQTITPNVTIAGFATGQGAALSATGTYTSGGSSVSSVGSGYGVSTSSENITQNSGTSLSNYAIGGTTLANGSNSVSLSGTGSITPAPLTIALGSVTKTYDGSSTAYLTSAGESVTTNGITQTVSPNTTLSGWVTGQGAIFSGAGTYSGSGAPNVGSGYSVSASSLPSTDFTANSGTSLSNYILPASASVSTASITPAPLTVTLAPTKIYDGTTSAALSASNTTVSGTVTGQSVTLSGAPGIYASPNAGSEAVTANLGASDFTAGSGSLLSNYMLEGTPLSGSNTATVTGTGTIGKADLSATGTQIYNGTTVFGGSNLRVTGVDGQSFSATGSGVLSTANVQTGQNLSSVSGISLTGNGGALTGNYNPLATSQTSVTVSPDPILVSGTMVYNGTTSMPGSDLSAQAYLSSTNTSYTFALTGTGVLGGSGSVQTGQNLSSLGTLALTGTGSSNFTPTVAETSVSVTPAQLTVTVTNPTKIYDGATTATLTASNTTVSGFVSGQGAAFEGATGAYSQSNVGSALPVTADLSAGNFNASSGTAMSNYQISGTRMTGSNAATVTGTGTITPAVLSATGSQVYNGTTSFSGSNLTLTGGVDGQSFTAAGSGTLGSSGNVQTNQNLSSLGTLALDGVGGASTSNYTFGASNTSVSVTPAPLTLTLNNPTKTYDGTTTATLTSSNTSLSGFVGTQSGTFNGASGHYQSANAGTGISVTAGVTASDLTAGSGTSLSNYQINAVTLSGSNTATVTGTGSITPANLTATGSQIYNGSTNFSGSNLTVTGVDGQSFTAGGTGTLGNSGSVQASQNLSSVSGLTLTGNNGALTGNYNPLATSQTSVTVTSAPIQISGTMVYNGTTSMPGSDLSAQAYLSGANFVFTLSGSGTLGSSGNVQSNQNLSSMGTLALVGTGSGNFTPTVAETSVSVTPAPLTVTVTNPTKIYDGTTSATLTASNTSLSGFVSGQGAAFVGATGTYQSANAGTGINVTAGVTALDFTQFGTTLLSNYQISGTPMTGPNVATVSGTGSITPAPLSATGSQVYNGTTSFAGSNLTLTGGVDGQSFTAGGSGTLGSSGNVQTNQALASVSGITLSGVSGANPANYTLGATNTQVSVTQAPLTLSLTTSPISKVYDGTSNAYLSSGSEAVTTNGILQNVSPNVTVSGFVSGQGATFSGAGTYSGSGAPNVGSGYVISSSGLSVSDFTNSLSGTFLSNYSLATTSLTGTGSITPAPVTVTGLVATNKVYDGTTGATLSNAGSLSGLVSGQSLTLSSPTTVDFSTANAGTGLTVTASGYQISNGTGLVSNYSLGSSLAQTTANITPAPLTLSTTASKIYDGTSSIPLSGTDTTFAGFVAGQSGGLGTTVTGTLSQSAVGTNLGGTLSLSGGEMTGSAGFLAAISAGDYTLPSSFSGGAVTPATNATTSNVTQSTALTAQTSAQATASSSASSTLGTSTSTGGLTFSGMSLASSGSSAGSVGGSTSGSSSGSSSSIGGSGTSVVDTTSSQFSGLVNSGTSGGSESSGQASPQVSSLALTTGSLSFSVVGGGVSGGSSTVSIQGGGVSGGSSSGSSSLSVQGNGVSGGTSSGSSSLSVQGNGVSGGTSSGSSSLSVQGSGVSGSQGAGKTSTAP